MEDARLDGRHRVKPVVEHLLEDLGIAEEGGGGLRVAVEVGGVGIGLEGGDAVGQGGVRGIQMIVLAGQDAQPHGGVRLGGQAIPEGAEERVEVERVGFRGIVGLEQLAEEGLDDGDLDQGRGRGRAAGDGGRKPVGAGLLRARHRLDQPGEFAPAVAGPAPSGPRSREPSRSSASSIASTNRADRAAGWRRPAQVRRSCAMTARSSPWVSTRNSGRPMIKARDPPQATTPQHGRYVRRTWLGGLTPSRRPTDSIMPNNCGASTLASTGPRSLSGSSVSTRNHRPPSAATTSDQSSISLRSQDRIIGTIPPQASIVTVPASVPPQ